jgi:hypothetical protein
MCDIKEPVHNCSDICSASLENLTLSKRPHLKKREKSHGTSFLCVLQQCDFYLAEMQTLNRPRFALNFKPHATPHMQAENFSSDFSGLPSIENSNFNSNVNVNSNLSITTLYTQFNFQMTEGT